MFVNSRTLLLLFIIIIRETKRLFSFDLLWKLKKNEDLGGSKIEKMKSKNEEKNIRKNQLISSYCIFKIERYLKEQQKQLIDIKWIQ